jgi:hypothetical protein
VNEIGQHSDQLRAFVRVRLYYPGIGAQPHHRRRLEPCCNIRMDEYMAELARRFAASFISVQMHTSFNTEYRKLKDQRPGELWFSLAGAATEAIAAHGQQAEAFFKAETTGPPQ